MNPMRCALTLLLALVVGLPLHAKKLKVSIYSDTSSDYERSYQTDGSPVPERYALGFGGIVEGTAFGPTQSKGDFPEIASVIATHLAEEGYYFAEQTADAELLLVIHWGATRWGSAAIDGAREGMTNEAINQLSGARRAATAGALEAGMVTGGGASSRSTAVGLNAQLQSVANADLNNALLQLDQLNRARDRAVASTAAVLGYTDALIDVSRVGGGFGKSLSYDLRWEIEDPRYYVVVIAYDFRELLQKKKRKICWETRMSIRVQGNDFMEKLDKMVARASDYFGRDSKRLIRRYQGDVEIGKLQVVGTDAKLSDDED